MSIIDQITVRHELFDELSDLLTPEGVKIYGFRYMPLEYPAEAVVYYLGGTPGANYALGSGEAGSAYYRFGFSVSVSIEKFGQEGSDDELDRLEALIFNWVSLVQDMPMWTRLRFASESFRPPLQSAAAKVKYLNMQFLLFPRRITG